MVNRLSYQHFSVFFFRVQLNLRKTHKKFWLIWSTYKTSTSSLKFIKIPEIFLNLGFWYLVWWFYILSQSDVTCLVLLVRWLFFSINCRIFRTFVQYLNIVQISPFFLNILVRFHPTLKKIYKMNIDIIA